MEETTTKNDSSLVNTQITKPVDDWSVQSLKIPPHSIEAEQAVLGGLMLDPNAWDQIADRIVAADFYRRDHSLIFQAIAGLIASSKPIDVITVSEVYTDLAYLGALAKNTPSAANILAYADIVKEKALLRKLINIGEEISELGFNAKGKIAKELVDEAESKVFAIAEHHSLNKHGIKTIAEVLTSTISRIELLSESDSPITGISSGFTDFDKITSGLQRSDLVIIAGRPSMGKTTFAMNIAEWISMKNDKPVLIFSMEMPSEQLAMRMLASLARIELQRIRNGQLHDEDWPRLSSAIALMASRKMFIDDSGSLSPIEVRARARRLMREQGELGLIVIDYLQLMRVPGNNEHRAAEISEISRSLKTLARELNVPVVALSQLNRSLEQRTDRRPIMSDLRESGAIEQDADLIAFIYRDEMYNKETADKGIAEIIIAKQRNGPTGITKLTFLGHFSRFENFAQQVMPVNH